MTAFKDITGQRFGRLVAIKIQFKDTDGKYHWKCKCDCGKAAVVPGYCLRRGQTKSCGCLTALRRLDLTGRRFGRLIAIKPIRNKRGTWSWKCKCDCGHFTIVDRGHLTHGAIRSCGCIKSEGLRTRHGARQLSHTTPEYRSWCAMWTRCTNPNFTHYARYGGRGIKVCKRWKQFENFLTDMGPRPKGTSIHRLNNDGNYQPANCVWATPLEQAKNRSSIKAAANKRQRR